MKDFIKKYSLTENGIKLGCIKIKKFNSFIDELVRSRQNNYIFRGTENLDSIMNSNGVRDFNRKFFVLGEKANQFLQFPKEEDIVSYDKDSNKDFIVIFNILHSLFSGDIDDPILRDKIQTFVEKEDHFVTYFKNVSNRMSFIENVNKLDSINKKKVKDYYFAFLHTVGSKGYHSKSYFLSTSKNKDIAKHFKGKNGKIIIGWLPRNLVPGQLIKFKSLSNMKTIFEDERLPICATNLFPEEEISLKCGLPADYIIGYVKDENFEINPNILNISGMEELRDATKYGLAIDKSKLETILKLTEYCKSYYIKNADWISYDQS